MQRVKEYLEEIKVPYTEENADGMPVLKLNYHVDLLTIFPPDEGDSGFLKINYRSRGYRW